MTSPLPLPDPGLPGRPETGRRAPGLRLDADPDDVGRGLGRLVLALLDIVRQLLERQALRRVDGGDLTPDEVERLGQALIALEEKFVELREVFGVEPGDLSLPVDLDALLEEGRAGPRDASRTAPGEKDRRTTRPGGRTP